MLLLPRFSQHNFRQGLKTPCGQQYRMLLFFSHRTPSVPELPSDKVNIITCASVLMCSLNPLAFQSCLWTRELSCTLYKFQLRTWWPISLANTESSCCIYPLIHDQPLCIMYLECPIQFYYTYNYISLFICIVDVTLAVQESNQITSKFFSIYNLEETFKYTILQAIQDTITVCV